MPSKRKRVDASGLDGDAHGKQAVSAFAAARSRAHAAREDGATPGAIREGQPVHSLPRLERAASVDQSPASEVQEDEVEQDAPVARLVKLSSWPNNPDDILSNTDVELVINLQKHVTIALIGSFAFNVIRGAININGANISASSQGQHIQTYRAFVPVTHPILSLRGLDGTNHVRLLDCKAPAPLANINPLFGNIWHAESSQANGRSFSIVTDSSVDQFSPELCPDAVPEDWLRTIEACTTSPGFTFIAGSSGSGKSMFTRRLINRCLTGLGKTAQPVPVIFFLDLDPNQQEYMPSGQISLVAVRDLNLGPEFTHPAVIRGSNKQSGNELIRAHPMPVNLAVHVDFYYACVEDLFRVYLNLRSRPRPASLIVKTPGFLYTSYFGILSKLLLRLQPNNVVHLSDILAVDLECARKSNAFQAACSQGKATFHDIAARPSSPISIRSKTEINIMQLQSYFHLTTDLTWELEPLSKAIPWEFCYHETNCRLQDFVGFATYTDPVDSVSMIHLLNGSVVHILLSSSLDVVESYAKLPRTDKYHIPYFPISDHNNSINLLDPSTSNLMCMAMIRGFDPERRVVQVLIPRTHEYLLRQLIPSQTVFVYGCCDAPGWAFQEDEYAQAASIPDEEMVPRGDMCMWVEGKRTARAMGYLNALRRVRKFQS